MWVIIETVPATTWAVGYYFEENRRHQRHDDTKHFTEVKFYELETFGTLALAKSTCSYLNGGVIPA